MTRDGGRYVVTGQLGGHQVPVSPGMITRRHLSILGCFSGEAAQYWRALQFMSRTKEKYNFDALISGRYTMDEVNLALDRMQSFQEIKPVVYPGRTGTVAAG